MLVILREDFTSLGKAGDVVKVKDGYGRNYLIPKKIAYPATDAYMNKFKETTKSKTFKDTKLKKDANALREVLEKTVLKIEMKSGAEGKLFGSVTSANIVELAKEKGIELDKKRIVLDDQIKTAGEHKIVYKLHNEVETTINLLVLVEETK